MSLVLEQGKKYRIAAIPELFGTFGVKVGDEFTPGRGKCGAFGSDGFICDGPPSWNTGHGQGKMWFPRDLSGFSHTCIEEVADGTIDTTPATTPNPTDRLCTLINELYVAKTRKNEAAIEGLVELSDILVAGDHTFTHVSIPDATWVSLPAPVRNAMLMSLSITAVDTIRGEMS